MPNLFALTSQQLVVGMSAALVIYFVGTSLPIMVFIYAILLPRYMKLTGSVVTTVILGGATYAAVHFFEAWTMWNTLENGVLSIIFLMFQYLGPGMVKSVLTVRTLLTSRTNVTIAYSSATVHVCLRLTPGEPLTCS